MADDLSEKQSAPEFDSGADGWFKERVSGTRRSGRGCGRSRGDRDGNESDDGRGRHCISRFDPIRHDPIHSGKALRPIRDNS
jgi:hypothetical protein